ncbi:uncharacterized protein LOC128953397 [Oppia nitens]|uniref:uncharacterized protein LOC128953397 n=1 Tax=Oppia nitens TaxID=1686743 RepID=UPI0023DAD9EC|nr:uncharacterized protein LOC128953397 [Oppia nitens]
MSQPIRSLPDSARSLYRGCPACDRIIAVFDISIDGDNPNPANDFDIRDINDHFSGNNVNHINPHIKYYPYECRRCHESLANTNTNTNTNNNNGSTIVRTATKNIIRRHIISQHLLREALDKQMLELEVDRLTVDCRLSLLDSLSI